jgi:hypothetical protein
LKETEIRNGNDENRTKSEETMFVLLVAVAIAIVHAQEFQPLKPHQVPCIAFDRCGVCLGDDACVDCNDVPFGTASLDANGNCVDTGNAVTVNSSASSSVSAVALAVSSVLLAISL